jgi:hypothetical protein
MRIHPQELPIEGGKGHDRLGSFSETYRSIGRRVPPDRFQR